MSRKYQENNRLAVVIAAVVVIATLYFAKAVFIPFALALLFSLFLSPIVGFLEHLKFPRLLAVALVVVSVLAVIGLAGWQVSQQLVDFTSQIPSYKKTVLDKIHFLNGERRQNLNKATDTVKELEREILSNPSAPATASEQKKNQPGSSPARPLSVEVVPPMNPVESIQYMLGPLTTTLVVLVFTVFVLVGREDLRNRLIRLAGGHRLNLMTQAMDDAIRRINRYLFLQLLVNSGFGAVIGIALHFIGVPNAILWGITAGVLRFLPYVGAPLAAIIPIFLSIAVFPGISHALATAGAFLILEIIVGNIVEPLLYGSHIGLSPLAILVAAVFWTLIWGFPGLVLSTPLTVCLVVMGRYIPSLEFLHVLLGDEPVLPLHAHFYQRLLAGDQMEARQILDESLKNKSLEELYGTVVIPALSLAEQDRHRNELDSETETFIYQSTREMIEELGDPLFAETLNSELSGENNRSEEQLLARDLLAGPGTVEILCIPARDEADETIATMLAQLLERGGHRAQALALSPSSEILAQIHELKPSTICISALPPLAIDHARAIYAKLSGSFPSTTIVVCLWNFAGDHQKTAARLRVAPGNVLLSSLPEVLAHFSSPLAVAPEPQSKA